MKTLTVLLFILFTLPAVATTYFVSPEGRDDDDGTSEASPFRSIQRINSLELNPGDEVLFERGGVYPGQLTVNTSGTEGQPIVFGAYGTGDRPVITGAVMVDDWEQEGDVFHAPCDSCPSGLDGMYIDERLHQLARYPNNGYLTMDSVQGKTRIYNDALTEPENAWAGAEVFARTEHWVIDRFIVDASEPGELQLTVPDRFYDSYDLKPLHGFFFRGTAACFDRPGEYYIKDDTLYLRPLDEELLSEQGASIPMYRHAFDLSTGADHIHLENLTLEKSVSDLIRLVGTSNISIKGCSFRHAGNDGVGGMRDYDAYNEDITITDCDFEDIANVAINFTYGERIEVYDNVIRRVGLVPGRGEGYDGGYQGIYLPDHCTVSGNRLDSIGYIGINVRKENVVRHNVISHFGLTKNDVGGIYSWKGDNNLIEENIVYDGFGNGTGTTYANGQMVYGIYPDDSTTNTVIQHNTCFRNEAGIRLHNAHHITIKDNVLYDNTLAQLKLVKSHIGTAHPITDCVVESNVFAAVSPNQLCVLLETDLPSVLPMFDRLDNNRYINPYTNHLVVAETMPEAAQGNYTVKHGVYNLSEWQEFTGKGASAFDDYSYPQRYAAYEKNGSNLIRNSTFSSGTDWWWTYDDDYFSLNTTSASGMDGTVLHAAYSETTGWHPGNWGISNFTIEQEMDYLLTYSTLGQQRGNYKIAMNDNEEPYTPSASPAWQYGTWQDSVTQDTVLFQGKRSTVLSLVFQSTNHYGDVFMDNVELHEVTVDTTGTTPHAMTKLFWNDSDRAMELDIAGQYRYLNGHEVQSALQLEPYRAIVLKKKVSEGPVGINKEEDGFGKLQLYPIPVSDRLTLLGLRPDQVEIFDMQGRLVKKVLIRERTQKTTIGLGDLTSGIYIVRNGGQRARIIVP